MEGSGMFAAFLIAVFAYTMMAMNEKRLLKVEGDCQQHFQSALSQQHSPTSSFSGCAEVPKPRLGLLSIP